MSTSNAFQNFRASLDGMVTSLGSGADTWAAVAEEYSRALRASIAMARGLATYDLPHATFHLMATDAELDSAIGEAERRFRLPTNVPPGGQAAWGGAHLVIFGEAIMLAGSGLGHMVALVGKPETTTSLRTREPITKYSVFLTEFGKTLLGRGIHSIGKPTSTYAQSPEAAAKSVQRLVESFFKVTFTNARGEAR